MVVALPRRTCILGLCVCIATCVCNVRYVSPSGDLEILNIADPGSKYNNYTFRLTVLYKHVPIIM